MKNLTLSVLFLICSTFLFASEFEYLLNNVNPKKTTVTQKNEINTKNVSTDPIFDVTYLKIKNIKSEIEEGFIIKNDDDNFVRVRCSRIIGGRTYEVEAGWLLTSRYRAVVRCQEKLDAIEAAIGPPIAL